MLEVEGDLDRWAEFVAEDAIQHPPGEPALRGIRDIREWNAKFFDLPLVAMEPSNQTTFVSASRDLACIVCDLRIVLDDPGGATEQAMKAMAVWRRSGGSWKVVANSWSTNTAP